MTWLRDALERALSTFAQAFVAVVGGDVANLWHIDWKAGIGVALGGLVLSVLKSAVARYVGTPDTASLAD